MKMAVAKLGEAPPSVSDQTVARWAETPPPPHPLPLSQGLDPALDGK